MSSSSANDNFLYTFTKDILNFDKSIRWVGVINKDGIIINEQYREGLQPFLSKEENQEYAINTIIRHKTRIKYESKMGKIIYSIGKYENLNRSTIPINENYYLLLTMDFDQYDFDKIITEKIIPLIKEKIEKFQQTN